MNQRSIKMDNTAVTAALFGSFDVNTRILENRFGVSLHNRSDGDGGDAVLISGESPEAVMPPPRRWSTCAICSA